MTSYASNESAVPPGTWDIGVLGRQLQAEPPQA